jgi:hypothetical protein
MHASRSRAHAIKKISVSTFVANHLQVSFLNSTDMHYLDLSYETTIEAVARDQLFQQYNSTQTGFQQFQQ